MNLSILANRRAFSSFGIGTALILGLYTAGFAQQASPEGPICKIVDGDTFHFCSGLQIRLDSIDAPESKEPFYWESRRTLASFLQTRNVKVSNCRTDKTGKRQACQVFADGKDVQAEMVREGMAWDWPKYSHGRYAEQEKEAKAYG